MMEVDSSPLSSKNPDLIFPHKLSHADREKLNCLLSELNADFERRCKMLMDRLDVTMMSFLGASRLEDKEDELKEAYKVARGNIAVPKPAGIEDLYSAKKDLLKIQKAKTSNKTDVHQYIMKEVPPSRGGTQKLSAPLSFGFSSRGREFRRGRGSYSGPKQTLQKQIQDEINRQLNVSDDHHGPYHNKRKRDRHH